MIGLLIATVVPALVLCALVAAEGFWQARRRRAMVVSNPSALLDPIVPWPGIRALCGIVGLGLIFLVCYQLLVPIGDFRGGHRVPIALRAAAAIACACAVLVQVWRSWVVGLADIALGLFTLAACTLATVFVPAEPHDLPHRYPLIFTAIVFAFGLMTWFWSWLADVWRQQLDEVTKTCDPAWTTAGRLIPVNHRFSLVACFGGLAAAVMMSIWPVLPMVSADDDSLGRVAAGVAAHLLLLLAALGCARRTNRLSFRILSLLTALSMVTFLVVRILPYKG